MTPREVAERLTKAQRRILLQCASGDGVDTNWRTLNQLVAKGLITTMGSNPTKVGRQVASLLAKDDQK